MMDEHNKSKSVELLMTVVTLRMNRFYFDRIEHEQQFIVKYHYIYFWTVDSDG